MPKVVIAKELLGKENDRRKTQCEEIIAALPEGQLTALETKTGINALKARLAAVDCVVICKYIETKEGIEELLGAYYPGGLPKAIWEQIPDTTGLTRGKPAIALFADALDNKALTISSPETTATNSAGNSLWSFVLRHEIGHAVLLYGIKNYHEPTGLFLAEAAADWFAWQTSAEEQFIFRLIKLDPQSPYRAYEKILDASDKLKIYLAYPERIIRVFDSPDFINFDESFPTVWEQVAASFSVFGSSELMPSYVQSIKAKLRLEKMAGRR